mgnify:CR=1|jgi:hypothetical protein
MIFPDMCCTLLAEFDHTHPSADKGEGLPTYQHEGAVLIIRQPCQQVTQRLGQRIALIVQTRGRVAVRPDRQMTCSWATRTSVEKGNERSRRYCLNNLSTEVPSNDLAGSMAGWQLLAGAT